ncbi:cbb3-type cytochrome c oxidase subunit I [Pararcticibacter amylolyticus]|uniref:Cytochrome C oxidase subunit I n=1 Tax=Pararcticibacter amylolyticus TaxID=2173175 RepID=A0A2U2PG16_9SPHI|nr:cbb3-type cytochrome c oxidase subunit I [Pararcticibacter amylolyticus]PWG80341.1 cytochrome C oxidase subunit I [Pararcticibacter amylolyticus]
MFSINRFFIKFSLAMLIAALLFGTAAAFAFLYPEHFNKWLPFQQMRPMHTSAALFWIISGAAACVCHFQSRHILDARALRQLLSAFKLTWMLVIMVVFACYCINDYGGREYWEFPPFLNLPLLAGWVLFAIVMLAIFKKSAPAYEWMWITGVIFFLITFTEQNLWHLSWFRESYIREVTVQWKANGSMVGAWNQMINGLSVFLIIRISGNKETAYSKMTFFLFFLGLFNLMFNWGHHVYNLPNANWMRGVAYGVSMTEWVILVILIRNFKRNIQEGRKLKHSLSYRFISSAQTWILANLGLALLMSIPAINRYTHGTHITVAHAMGTTIGINTMILLAAVGYILHADDMSDRSVRTIKRSLWFANASLWVFWSALVVAGILKGYLIINHPEMSFTDVMQHVTPFILIMAISGILLIPSLGLIAFIFIRIPAESGKQKDKASNAAERDELPVYAE